MPNVTLKRWDGNAWVELLPTPGSHTHAASSITSGILSTARLGTGTADATTFLRGDGTWVNPIFQGTNVYGSTYPGAYNAPGGGVNTGVILYGDFYGWHTRAIGSSGQVLTVANGVPVWATPTSGTVTGTGTANQLTYWTGTSAIGALSTATYPSLTELSYVKGVTSAIQTQFSGKYDKLTDHYLFSSFSMIEGESPQYILLCRNASNNNVNGTLQINRTTGNYQAANLDVVISSGASVGIQGGSLISNQAYQQTIPGEEKYDLVTLTRTSDSTSWIAIRYQGNTFPSTTATFTGYLQSTSGGFLTTLGAASVTSVTVFNTNSKVNFSASNVEIQENKVWHEGNDGTGSGLDADLLDGNHASAFALDGDVVKLTGNQTVAGIKTFTSQLQSGLQGNIAGGNIRLGVTTDATTKYGFITGTHYSSTAEPEGVSIIGLVSNSTENNVMIGGHIYEANPATSIQFYTNPTTTQATGGLERMRILSDGKVGIGTSAPARLLSLVTSSNDDGLQIRRSSTTTNEYANLSFVITNIDSTTSMAEIRGVRTNRAVAGDSDLVFVTRSNSFNTEKMRIRDDGNVGIGTASPVASLHIASPTTAVSTRVIRVGSGSTTTNNENYIEFPSSTADVGTRIGGGREGSGGASFLRLHTVDSGGVVNERMRITSDGKVGIGTASPTTNLHVAGTSTNVALKVIKTAIGAGQIGIAGSSSNLYISNTTDGDGNFAVANRSITLTNTGNVGIGTTAPNQALHIIGGLRIESAYPEIYLTDSNSDSDYRIINNNGDFGIYDETNTSFRMMVKTTGLVGINETSPVAQLQVKSGATTRVPLIVDTLASHATNLAEYKVNGTTRLVIDSSGKLKAGSGDGEIHVTSSGVRIETLADNAFTPLTVNKDDTNTSAHLQNWQLATNTVAYVDETGELYTPALASINGSNYATLNIQSSPTFTRNINDATATLTVNNANALSTGNLLNLQSAGVNVISFKKDGTLLAPATFTIDPSAYGDATGKVIILGDLQVDGTTTTINSTTLDVDDKNITVSKGAPNKAASDGGGLTVDLGTDGTATLTYGSTADIFSFNKGLNVGGTFSASSSSIHVLERTSTATNSNSNGLVIRHTTTADMVDGFASGLSFDIKDSAGVNNNIALINAIRSGADNSGRIGFQTASSGSLTERMTIMPNGRVGIGTTAPNDNLHIGAVGAVLRVGPHYPTIDSTSDRDFITLTAGGNDSVIATINEIFTIQNSQSAGVVRFNTEGTEKVRIAANGSVGIGTASPSELLDVNGVIKATSLKINAVHLQDTATVTTTSTTQTVLATYAVATYATGKFLIQATTGVNRHISELLVTHNGTVSTATEYAILKTSGNLFTVTTDISGGNVRILVTSTSATSTAYKTTFTLIGV